LCPLWYLARVRLPSFHRVARFGPVLAVAAFAVGALAAPAARAHGGTVDAAPVPTPAAPPGDGATAEQILKRLATLDERLVAVVAEPVKQAKKALERAHGARTAGDTAHARMLDALALEWAQTAETLTRAAKSEEGASAAQKQAQATATQLERGRTLLEETQARRGRVEAELARAEADAKQAADDAKAAEQARLTGKKGKDPKAKDPKAKDPKAKPPEAGPKKADTPKTAPAKAAPKKAAQ